MVLQNNLGDTTYAYGLATLSSGATSVTVTHGLDAPPTLADISVTPAGNLGSASKFWISDPTATTFKINVNTSPGSSVDFSWRARIYVEP